MKKTCKKPISISVFILMCVAGILLNNSALAQGTQVNFNTIPSSGTVLVYSHQDDDVIWMLPWWNKAEEFIQAAVPSSPIYRTLIQNQQTYMDGHGYSIPYQSNWVNPWTDISDLEYFWYYWNANPSYNYIDLDHLITKISSDTTVLTRSEINKMKAKLEQYIASPSVSRIITHNNWGEYGHGHHKAVNKAVRELAVKYRKDVWMLGTDQTFVNSPIPNGANTTYTLANYDATLFAGIRNEYFNVSSVNNYWTWDPTFIPTGNIKYIKIVDAGVDQSDILLGQSVSVSGAVQDKPGSFIFNGVDNYMTLPGNAYTEFTIAMWVRPSQIKAMDISKMSEYPAGPSDDRSFYLQSNGHVTARINDGQSRTVTSNTALTTGNWTHVLMTSDGSTLKIYINGSLENNTPAGQAFTGYSTPEFVLGQPQETPNYFNGQIYDVRLFDHVLSDSEIAALGGSGTVTYTITATASAGGTINPSGPVLVNQGTNKTFSINPNSGFQIANVSIDNSPIGAQSSYTFTNINANHTISASFSSIPVTNLTISGVSANSKVYNRTTSATLNTGGATLVGVLGSDNVVLVTSSATGGFINKNVGTGKTVNTTGFTLSGPDAGKYSVTQPTTTANITAASLSISGVTVNNKVYDQTTTATLNTGSAGLSGVFGADAVNLVSSGASGSFADNNAGTGKPVSISGFTITGADAGNYTFSQPSSTASITPASLSVTGVTAANKVYDRTTAATINIGSASLSGILGGDVVNLISSGVTGSFANKNAGSAKSVTTSGFTIGGNDAGNYSLAQATTIANITKAGLTLSGVTANNKVYDGITAATLNSGSASLVGILGADLVSLVSTGATGTFADKIVGTGIPVSISGFTLGGSDANNYSLTQPSSNANITSASLTVSGLTANNKVYDGTTTAIINTGSTSLTGVFGGDVVNLRSSGVTGSFANKNAGSGKTVSASGFALTGNDAGNYTVIQPATSANITTAGLTLSGITANNKVYNSTTTASLNTGSASLVGILGVDVVSLVSTGATGTFANKNVGTGIQVTISGFTVGGSDGGNYALTQPSSSANITPASLTVTGVTANNKVYDGTVTASLNKGSAALAGVFGGDNVSLNSTGAAGTFVNSNVGTAKPVLISGFTLGGTAASDYSLIQPSAIANITGVSLIVTGISADNKVYDATTLTTVNSEGATLVGIIGTDNVTINSTEATGSFANRNVGTGKAVAITGLTLSGPDAGKYSLIQPSGTASITPAGLTISGVTAISRVYNGTTSTTLNSVGATPMGIFGGDIVSIISSGAAGSFEDKNAGTGKPVVTSGYILGGANAGNYTLTQPVVSANIIASSLTLSGVTAINKVYDGTTTASLNTGEGSLVGVYGGDDVTINSSAANGNFEDKNVGIAIPVSASGFLLGGTDAPNYTLIQPSLIGNISAKPLTITANDQLKPFRTKLTFTGTEFSATGLVTGDEVSGIIIDCPGTPASADVGTYVISVSGGINNNYHFSYVSGKMTVSKSTIIVTADNKTKVYGSENPVLTISYSGFINDENESVLTLIPVAVTDANTNSDSGEYEIVVSGAASENYSFAYNKGVLTIIKADQVITFTKLPADLRMTEVKPLIATAASGLPVSFESSDPVIGRVIGNELSINRDGNVTITAIQEGDHNWNPATDVSQTIVTLPSFDNIMSLFTPNNDGINDYWYIPDLGQYGKLQVTVYNRFGQIVYQSDSYKNDWDGTRDGYPLPSATYYYLIKSSEKGFIKGVVNIIR